MKRYIVTFNSECDLKSAIYISTYSIEEIYLENVFVSRFISSLKSSSKVPVAMKISTTV